MLEKLKKQESPKAKDSIQKLADYTAKIGNAVGHNDLKTANEELKGGAKGVEKLLSELNNQKVRELYSNVEKKNIHLNKKLDSGKGKAIDVDNFFKYIRDGLAKILNH